MMVMVADSTGMSADAVLTINSRNGGIICLHSWTAQVPKKQWPSSENQGYLYWSHGFGLLEVQVRPALQDLKRLNP